MKAYLVRVLALALVVVLAEMLTTDDKYKNQLKLVLALVFALGILSPLRQILFETDYEALLSDVPFQTESEISLAEAETRCLSLVAENYRSRITSAAESKIGGGVKLDFTLSEKMEDYGAILSVTVTGGDYNRAKEVLCGFYNVPSENIYYQSGGEEN